MNEIYDIYTGFGHFAIPTEDICKLVEDIRAKGGNITWEAGPVKEGSTLIAFVKDPDGYLFLSHSKRSNTRTIMSNHASR